MDNPMLSVLGQWRKADFDAVMAFDVALSRFEGQDSSMVSPEWVEMFELVFRRDDTASLRRLMEHFGSPNFEVEEGKSRALMMAAFHGAVECVKLLVSAGADVDASDTDGFTAAHHAMREEAAHIEVFEILMRAGADPWARAENGARPFEMAVFRWQKMKTSKAASGLAASEFWRRVREAADQGEVQRKLRLRFDKEFARATKRAIRAKERGFHD